MSRMEIVSLSLDYFLKYFWRYKLQQNDINKINKRSKGYHD